MPPYPKAEPFLIPEPSDIDADPLIIPEVEGISVTGRRKYLETAAAKISELAPLNINFIEGRFYFDLFGALRDIEKWEASLLLPRTFRDSIAQVRAEYASFMDRRVTQNPFGPPPKSSALNYVEPFGPVYWRELNGREVLFVTYKQFVTMIELLREGNPENAEVIENIRRAYNTSVTVALNAERLFHTIAEVAKTHITLTDIWRKNQRMGNENIHAALAWLVHHNRIYRSFQQMGSAGRYAELYSIYPFEEDIERMKKGDVATLYKADRVGD